MQSPSSSRYPLSEPLLNGASSDMAVDGSTTAKHFSIYGVDDKIIRISALRFLVHGQGLNVDSREFFYFGYDVELGNGLQVRCKRLTGERDLLQPIKRVGDFLAYTDDVVRLDHFDGKKDYLVATVGFSVTVDLFSSDDWLRVAVQDDMSGLESMKCLAVGFVEQDS